ncbi:DUF1993 domain-containing protein [Devosia psychrophila]|uniref:DUF1993 domain-containing protein n=1 Tax=Devosia psychrophila TaxID=728005 RepID=A0A0F5Q2J8_9HYPH|nr:DUF1993 domain-containing protein [Devosia psychrophila]KKC34866.1 hypothetical protein WH91_01195 [Devosia psychrophila]SFC11122.1 hypothetical protein SAMN04488059_102170 [Devosia psychrophila]
MTISVYDVTVPVFTRMLTNLLAVMDKADANATERKFDTAVFSDMRLSPDMIPFRGQVMIATDHVKGCVSRLAGREVPSWPDTETTFEELRARIQKALDLLVAIKPEDLEGSEARDVTLKLGGKDVTMNGLTYLTERALPNFFFHVTTAYAILRHGGVPVGKRDYIG